MGGAWLERATSACKARAPAAVCCRLSLSPLGELRIEPGCCALLRFVASKVLPDEYFNVGDLAAREKARQRKGVAAGRAWV
jgi:hypothetical protein